MLLLGLLLIAIAIASFFYEQLEKRCCYRFTHNKKFISHTVIFWCCQYMGNTQKKQVPGLRINYYSCKSKLGEYDFGRKEIIIWVNKTTTVETLVSTLIHEFQHYLQLKNKNENKNYTKMNSEHGYDLNPYEVDARNAEKKYTNICIQYLIRKKLVKKI